MKSDETYLLHIRDAIGRIEQYSSVGSDVFLATPHWQDAIIRQLEIIGEASKGLSARLRDSHPEIPWRRIAGLRDVLIHGYMSVDLVAVWRVVETGIPPLKAAILKELSESNH